MSLRPVDVHDQLAEGRLVGCEAGPRGDEVIKLGDPVRLAETASISWVGCRDNGCSRKLADGDVIGMPVGAKGVKGDDDVRPHPAQVCNDFSNYFVCASTIQLAITIIQENHFLEAKHRGRVAQLLLADGA
jgi:hypothetical protein